MRGGGRVEATIGQELAGHRGVVGEQLGRVERGGGPVRGDQPGSGALFGPGGRAALDHGQGDPGALGQPLHGLGERQVLDRRR